MDGEGGKKGRITKGHRETFVGDGHFHYLGFMVMVSPVYTLCQNVSTYVLEMCIVYCISIILQQTNKQKYPLRGKI